MLTRRRRRAGHVRWRARVRRLPRCRQRRRNRRRAHLHIGHRRIRHSQTRRSDGARQTRRLLRRAPFPGSLFLTLAGDDGCIVRVVAVDGEGGGVPVVGHVAWLDAGELGRFEPGGRLDDGRHGDCAVGVHHRS